MPLLADIIVAAALVVTAIVAHISTKKVRQVNRRFRVLDEIARAAEDGGSLDETLEAIADILVPELGDFCAIDVIEAGEVRRAAVRVAGPDTSEVEAGLAARKPALQERMAAAAVSGRQEPRLFEYVNDAVLVDVAEDEEDLEFLRSLGIRSGLTLELRARGRPTGMLTLGMARSGRRLRSGDIQFATVLAGRVALALDNAGLFSEIERGGRERAEIAETLQRGLLPPPLPHIPGWTVAAMYSPAGAENEIGGDFYDAFRIAGGWMIVVGDVTGRGAHAAAVTAHARYTLRTAAALTGDPVVALGTLNRELLARRGAALCSVAAMAISEDPDEPVRLAVAGHPPPLLVTGSSVVAATSPAPVLGAFDDAGWRIERTRVAPGQQLVVITDGITEARGGEEDRFDEPRLRAELAGVASPALAVQKVEVALRAFTGGELEDDAAMIAVGPASAEAAPAPERERHLVEGLFDAFNRRDDVAITELCDPGMDFFPVGTAEQVGRTAPYVGPEGLREYMRDLERAWDELLITPNVIERRDGSLLVRGRVYARSRQLGIRDMPVAWIWDLAGDRFARGEVFRDPEEAVDRLAAVE
ncbi:MAG TPA: SpoIIE family protein phosphatase [Solirubrobacterales bacterium]|nr:SpoIIE family protein phosphatase [Solirubrobacterales bacterium]